MQGLGGGPREDSAVSWAVRADLLLIDGDPTADIANTLSIRAAGIPALGEPSGRTVVTLAVIGPWLLSGVPIDLFC